MTQSDQYQDPRTPMDQCQLKSLLSHFRECFLDGDTDQEIVEDVFVGYGAQREDLVALIRMMVSERGLRGGDKVHIDTDHPEWGRVASDGIILEQRSGHTYLVNVQSIRSDIIVGENDIVLK